jgi:hypothetical protein
MQLGNETVIGLFVLGWWLGSLGLAALIERVVRQRVAISVQPAAISRQLLIGRRRPRVDY